MDKILGSVTLVLLGEAARCTLMGGTYR